MQVFLPDNAPFTEAQRAWLNGFVAGLLGAELAPATPGAPIPAPAAALQAEDFPWHDPTLAIDERMKLSTDRPFERRLMAAMGQLDCGQCGYLCKTYAEAIAGGTEAEDRKSTRLNSSHANISYAVFCLKKKKNIQTLSLIDIGQPTQYV